MCIRQRPYSESQQYYAKSLWVGSHWLRTTPNSTTNTYNNCKHSETQPNRNSQYVDSSGMLLLDNILIIMQLVHQHYHIYPSCALTQAISSLSSFSGDGRVLGGTWERGRCFVWVPFRDTKYRPSLPLSCAEFSSCNLVRETPACTLRSIQKRYVDRLQI